MLDINFIRENQEVVKQAIKDKEIDLDLSELLVLDEQRRNLIAKGDELRKRSNEIADTVPKASDEKKKQLIDEGKKVKAEVLEIETKKKTVEDDWQRLMYLVPNIPSPDTPIGGEADFKVIDEWGKVSKFDFTIKDHIELGKALDIIDLERGVKVAGFRGYFLKNEGVLLHFGVLMLALKKMIAKGFLPMVTPTLVREEVLYGSGHFPGERREIYEVEEAGDKDKELKFLAGTAEPSLLAYHLGETLKEKDLPVKLCGISPCYRREVGGYGKDTKGVYRIHEFMKVEQVVLAKNDVGESEKIFQEMNENARELLRELALPHRVIQIASGDMGLGKYKMFDIETWMPGRQGYGETHSNSNLTDWQARRLDIKYRDKFNKNQYVHTLNNTVIASPRILIAILENNQQKDGSVLVPEALREFVGKDVIHPKK